MVLEIIGESTERHVLRLLARPSMCIGAVALDCVRYHSRCSSSGVGSVAKSFTGIWLQTRRFFKTFFYLIIAQIFGTFSKSSALFFFFFM